LQNEKNYKKKTIYKNKNIQRIKLLPTEDLNKILLHFKYNFRNEKFLGFEIGEDVKKFGTKLIIVFAIFPVLDS
jgi:hypothetical protein